MTITTLIFAVLLGAGLASTGLYPWFESAEELPDLID